jgi:hypothetical protein
MDQAEVTLADGLHARHCANPDCGGRAAHEQETGISYAELVDANLAEGWVAPGPPREVFGPFPVEAKVRAGSLWASVWSLAVGLALWVASNSALIAPLLPSWVVPWVVALAAGLASFSGGFRAEHTPRPANVVQVERG